MGDLKKLWVSVDKLQEAIENKDKLKALSFALAIKICFRNSGLKSTTNREIQRIFHVSPSTAKKVVEDGLRFGYLRRDIGMIIANKTSEQDKYNCKLLFKERPKSQVECPHSLKEIEDELRKALLLNHISKQTDTVNTLQCASAGATLNKRKKAQRKLKRMPPTSGSHEQLSLKTISKLLRICKTKARRLKDNLLFAGDITQNETKVLTSLNPITFNSKYANAWFKKSGFYGWLMRGENGIVCQLANVYRYSSNRISFR